MRQASSTVVSGSCDVDLHPCDLASQSFESRLWIQGQSQLVCGFVFKCCYNSQSHRLRECEHERLLSHIKDVGVQPLLLLLFRFECRIHVLSADFFAGRLAPNGFEWFSVDIERSPYVSRASRSESKPEFRTRSRASRALATSTFEY